ncbi:hypothetical protein BSZ32_03155 [Rubritalea profundi]|uniref:HMA domain-containing protein n=1 Tax=Rubritalea profundi TaxID=1658618 RepID=A0A2S7TXW9_9BACT|nr:hypothetical protein BSZ32_03155 [Rubritalea profundi]
MQSALNSVKGVSSAKCGAKTGNKAEAVVSAEASVKIADLITALKAKGYTATEKTAKKKDA